MPERKAKIVKFHPATTVIIGVNDTGKSSLIKSILRGFGAEPPIHHEWKKASVYSLLTFVINDHEMSIFRRGDFFSVFDENSNLIASFDSVSKGLGPFIAEKFSFGMRLQNQQGDFVIPPPAYLFLPFYFDQDRSWNATWNSFERLKQMKSWKNDLVEYHVGIRPNKFYELKGQQAEILRRQEETQREITIVKRVREELRGQLQEVKFTVDLEAFQKEITELLVECGRLQKVAEKVRENLVALHNERIAIEAQIEIVKGSLRDLGKDYDFLKKAGDHVDCTTCGASYESNFLEVFSIAVDEDQCEHFLHQLDTRLSKTNREITVYNNTHLKHEDEIARVKALLAQRKEQIQLKDLIENEGKQQVQVVLRDKIAQLNLLLISEESNLIKLKRELSALTNKERKNSINAQFRDLMKNALFRLEVHNFPESSYKTVLAKVKEQGSDLPRAVLAYNFSILNVMRERSSSAFCPIVIDSPIQQDQDKENHKRILEFIRDNRPTDSQMILGVVDAKGVDFGGDVIELTQKYSLLSSECFEEAHHIVSPFFEMSLLSN